MGPSQREKSNGVDCLKVTKSIIYNVAIKLGHSISHKFNLLVTMARKFNPDWPLRKKP